jgi:hypothetical protein
MVGSSGADPNDIILHLSRPIDSLILLKTKIFAILYFTLSLQPKTYSKLPSTPTSFAQFTKSIYTYIVCSSPNLPSKITLATYHIISPKFEVL